MSMCASRASAASSTDSPRSPPGASIASWRRWASDSICWASSWSSLTLTLLGEELADRLPDVVLRGDVAGADREPAALELGEDLGELRVARGEGGDAAGLAVAAVVHLLGDLGERAACLVAILGGVLAV